MTVITEPLPDHQAVRRVHEPCEAFHADRLGKHEVRTHVEGRPGIGILSNGQSNAGAVPSPFADVAKNLLKLIATAVENDSVETPVTKTVGSLRRGLEHLETHAEGICDALHDALDFRIIGQQQTLNLRHWN